MGLPAIPPRSTSKLKFYLVLFTGCTPTLGITKQPPYLSVSGLAMDPVTRTLIVGDSHVTRLTEFVFNPSHEYEGRVSLEMGLDADIIFQGIGGRTTAKITERDLTVLSDIDPHVIVLLVGGNALCAPEATSFHCEACLTPLPPCT